MATTPIFQQQTNSNLIQDYFAALLQDRHVLQPIMNIRPQFDAMSRIIGTVNKNPIVVQKRHIEQPFKDYTQPVASCVSTTLSNQNQTANVTITGNGTRDVFASPFSVRDNVTGTSGRIISHSATTLQLMFESNPNPTVKAFTSADFASGNPITQSLSATLPTYRTDRTTESMKVLPSLRNIYLETFSRSETLGKDEMIEQNRITDTENGMQFLSWYQIKNMMNEFTTDLEYKILYSDQVATDQYGNGGKMASLPWQIQNEGGIYLPQNAAPNEQTLMDAIEAMRAAKGRGGEFSVFAGTSFSQNIQKAVSRNWITYTGQNNTFGGESVDGINVKEYTYNDVTLKLVTSFNDWNNPAWNQVTSSITGKLKSWDNALILDTDPVETLNYGMQPFASTYIYDLNGKANNGYRVIENGSIDRFGNDKEVMAGGVPEVTWMREATSAVVLNRPQNSCFIELSA